MQPAKPDKPLDLIDPKMAYIARNPGAFALGVLKDFQANQGLLLAGAVAYYALLSIVPLLILVVIALSHVVDRAALLQMLGMALEYVAPGQGRAVAAELRYFVEHQSVGWVLLATMLFFSSLGFKVLEGAISVIFFHRIEQRRRHFLVSLLVLPFGYILFIAAALFVGTVLSVDLAALAERPGRFVRSRLVAGRGFARADLYCGRGGGDTAHLGNILFHAGRQAVRAQRGDWRGDGGAVVGNRAPCAGLDLGTLSQVNVVYGSLATAIIVLLSLELVATILLLGAQVIADTSASKPGHSGRLPGATPLSRTG